MCNLRDIVIFFAGAEFFHALSHFMVPLFLDLPLDMKIFVLTPTLNLYAVIGNAVIMVLLLWWAKRLSCKK